MPQAARCRRKLPPSRSLGAWRGPSFPTAGRKLKLRCHSDQFRQRFGLHLPHHVPALDLNRDFTGSELKSYLLIEHARNHHTHDLALAWGEQLVALSQHSQFALLLADYPVAIQSLDNRVQ